MREGEETVDAAEGLTPGVQQHDRCSRVTTLGDIMDVYAGVEVNRLTRSGGFHPRTVAGPDVPGRTSQRQLDRSDAKRSPEAIFTWDRVELIHRSPPF